MITMSGDHSAPETLRQAQRWDRVKRDYVDAGLCNRCAAQLAWGQDNAGGWMGLRPPCDACTPIVCAFPQPTANPLWQRFLKPGRRTTNPLAPPTCLKCVAEIHAPLSAQNGVLQ